MQICKVTAGHPEKMSFVTLPGYCQTRAVGDTLKSDSIGMQDSMDGLARFRTGRSHLNPGEQKRSVWIYPKSPIS
jgi:hypothetical protein